VGLLTYMFPLNNRDVMQALANKIPQKQNVPEPLWNKRDVARYLGISPATLSIWVHERRGPRFIKVGPLVRFRPADVYAYLESCPGGGGLASA
jgi:excisionase family DNA binding protein